jgi:4-hydroxy-2-oxoheptanedioate aldolase
VDLLVRVSRGSYSDYIRPLEMDATGIMVPHIMSLEDAKSVIRQTRFHPVGRRPLDGGNADGSYVALPLHEYLRTANQERFVIFQVEDPEVLDDMEAIAQLDGLDMLFFGPGDFSHAIGDPGNFSHPLLVESRRRMAQLAAKYGKFAGTVANLDNFQDLLAEGYNFLNLGADVGGLVAQTSKMTSSWASATGSAPERADAAKSLYS